MQNLLMAAVYVQEGRYWCVKYMERFGTFLVEDDDSAFWDLYEDVKADCEDLAEGEGMG
jgi:hypothetical protein